MVSKLKMCLPKHHECTVAIIGLGYVGLPLALEFVKKQPCVITQKLLSRKVIGFDIRPIRLKELHSGLDITNETTEEELKSIQSIKLTSNTNDLEYADVFIVTVPTPIDSDKKPDLTYLKEASQTIAKAIKARASRLRDINDKSIPIIIYESTVYPGVTEDVCIPIVENQSGMSLNSHQDFKGFVCGYSPERINPGDKKHRLPNIKKVTSGSSKSAAIWIDQLYGSIIKAGTHLAPSIKIAEAAKVIENTQRDLNIALVNELSIIFKHLGIDTLDVLEAAGSKWNFMPFRPGLVGGHCIGVDPYYLTYQAEKHGYYPEVVLAGRKINDRMGHWLAEQLILEMTKRKMKIQGAEVLILGVTFKENCPDIRNTKVLDMTESLNQFGLSLTLVDPLIDTLSIPEKEGIKVLNLVPKNRVYKAAILAVPHNFFRNMDVKEWQNLIEKDGILFDLKGIIPRDLGPIRI